MKIKFFITRAFCVFVFLTSYTAHADRRPRLVVVFVIDQLSQQQLEKIHPHLSGGFNLLLNGGIVYHNAHQPHSMPATATGHATLSTGTLPKDHGLIRNTWYNQHGKTILSDQDNGSPVFAPEGFYRYGRSSANLMVDTFTDQFVLATGLPTYALSLKSRAATALAGKMGKAIWFDNLSGNFTSSKAYFDKLPAWVQRFNAQRTVDKLKKESWHPLRPRRWSGYASADDRSYEHTVFKKSLIANPELLRKQYPPAPYGMFAKTPNASKLLFKLAKKCIDEHAGCDDPFVLWISVSPPDKAGHLYGPDSFEYLDMLYQVDQQMYDFIRHAKRRIAYRDILFVLTSDHGTAPLPELMQKRGYTSARRIGESDLIKKMNRAIQRYFRFLSLTWSRGGITKLVTKFKAPQFYFDMKIFNRISTERQKHVINKLKSVLIEEPGIKNAWTPEELLCMDPSPEQLEYYFKNQIYPGRSGQLIVHTDPYCSITKHKMGACHKTPYAHNTNVPLVFYQKHTLEDQHIHERVTMDQVANSLAYIVGTPQPCASTASVLPGIMEGPCCPF